MKQVSDIGSKQDPRKIADHLCIHHKVAVDLVPDWKERWKIPQEICKIAQRLPLGEGKEGFVKVFDKSRSK